MLPTLSRSCRHHQFCRCCKYPDGVMPGGDVITSVYFSRCMYHVLMIQLHYPLLARGHNLPMAPADGPEPFALCATAAKEIVYLLAAYNRTFSIRKAP